MAVIFGIPLLFEIFVNPGNREDVIVINPRGSAVNRSLTFEPEIITVIIGMNNSVIWVNEDNATHTTHSNVPEFDSGLFAAGGDFNHIFIRARQFPYHCDIHPWMTGTVIVMESR